MESNHQTSEGSVQTAGVCDSTPDEQQVQSQVRSYECGFCRKGFSNAQALGGHMNIHRKDKAKLKQAAKEAHRSPDSSRLANALTASRIKGKPLEFTSRQMGQNINAKWGGIFPPDHQEVSSFPLSRNESQMAETEVQLPLFMETANNRADLSKQINQQVSASWQEEAELDLELRLGNSPSPPPQSSVTTGTIKFF